MDHPEISSTTDDDSEIHPLEIDMIARNILKYMISSHHARNLHPDALYNLRNFRLVSNKWKECANSLLRVTRDAIVFGDIDIQRRRGTFNYKLQKFLLDMQESNDIPANAYSFMSNFFVPENEQLFGKFMLMCSPTIKELNIHLPIPLNMTLHDYSFRNVNLPMCEKLRIHCEMGFGGCDANNFNRVRVLISLLVQVVGNSNNGNLREFALIVEPGFFSSQYHEELRIVHPMLGSIFEKLPLASLRGLILQVPLLNEHFTEIAQKYSHLRQLHIDCTLLTCPIALERVLSCLAFTLSWLILDESTGLAPVCSSISDVRFPIMPQLKRLDFGINNIRLFGFRYEQSFPCLETLNLTGCQSEGSYVEFISPIKPCTTINEVHLPSGFSPSPTTNLLLKMMSKRFPSLSILHIHPCPTIPETLLNVFEYLANVVEELQITLPSDSDINIDVLLSGLSTDNWIAMLSTGNVEQYENMCDLWRTNPSLLDMKRLRMLSIVGRRRGGSFASHFLVSCVFARMTAMKYIVLSNFHISEESIELLPAHITLALK